MPIQLFKKIFSGSSEAAVGEPTRADRVRQILVSIGAGIDQTRLDIDSTEITDITFAYQGYNFTAFVRDDSEFMSIFMPNFIITDICNFNEIRYLTNHMIGVNSICQAKYMTDEDDNTVSASVAAYLPVSDDTDTLIRHLKTVLARMSDFRNEFTESFNDIIRERADANPFDFEMDVANRLRKVHLTRMSEAFHSAESELNTHTHPVPDHIPSLSSLMQILHGVTITGNVTVSGPDGLICTLSAGDAASHGILDDIWPVGIRRMTPVRFAYPWIVIRISGATADNGRKISGVTVTITDYGKDSRNGYVNIISTPDGGDPLTGTEVISRGWQPNTVRAVLIAPGASASEARSEFEYMLADAREKIMAGKEADLTPAQSLLMRAFIADTGYHLYHGSRMFMAGHMVQAVELLLNVFDDMMERYANMDEAARETFHEVCFMLGHAYSSFRHYDKAYYYLSMAVNNGNYAHDRAYIDCLVNSHDYRVLEMIDQALNDYTEFQSKQQPMLPIVTDMYNFLRRRRAYVLIQKGRLDEAETILKEMVDEKDNSEFAIDELAYIRRLRSK